jgi:hypothetical protein
MYRDGGRTKGCRQLCNCVRDGGRIADVSRESEGLSTRCLYLLTNPDGRGSVAIENAYRGTLGCKPDGDSAAYSIPCAGNYGDSFLKPLHNPSPS